MFDYSLPIHFLILYNTTGMSHLKEWAVSSTFFFQFLQRRWILLHRLYLLVPPIHKITFVHLESQNLRLINCLVKASNAFIQTFYLDIVVLPAWSYLTIFFNPLKNVVLLNGTNDQNLWFLQKDGPYDFVYTYCTPKSNLKLMWRKIMNCMGNTMNKFISSL